MAKNENKILDELRRRGKIYEACLPRKSKPHILFS